MTLFFLVIIAILILAIMLTVNIIKKGKQNRYKKAILVLIMWLIILVLELILINVYFAVLLK